MASCRLLILSNLSLTNRSSNSKMTNCLRKKKYFMRFIHFFNSAISEIDFFNRRSNFTRLLSLFFSYITLFHFFVCSKVTPEVVKVKTISAILLLEGFFLPFTLSYTLLKQIKVKNVSVKCAELDIR